MDLERTLTLNLAGGRTMEIPAIGFGTWASNGDSPTTPSDPAWIIDALTSALEVGYRHIDSAWFYGVDEEIGAGIRKSGVPRDELFISSKIWPNFYHPDAVELACDKILTGMGLDYIDCLLLHWPNAFKPISVAFLEHASAAGAASMAQKGMELTKDGNVVIDWEHTSAPIARAAGHPEGSIVPTWTALANLVKKGKVRSVGVSNFGIADLEALLPHVTDVPISVNQFEVHPWLPNTELVEFCQRHGIAVTCYSPFAGQKADGKTLIHDPTVQRLAKKNDMGPGQLLQSWARGRGTIPLGKSANKERMKANFSVRRLSDEDQKALDDLEIPNGQGRTIDFTEEWGVKLWQS